MYRSIAVLATSIFLACFEHLHSSASEVQVVRGVAQANQDDQQCLATTIYHEARRGEVEFDIELEKFVLSI